MCVCDRGPLLMGADSIDLTIWLQRRHAYMFVCMCVYVCVGHRDEPYQEDRTSSRLTDGQLRLAVWSVWSYLSEMALSRMCTPLDATFKLADLDVDRV